MKNHRKERIHEKKLSILLCLTLLILSAAVLREILSDSMPLILVVCITLLTLLLNWQMRNMKIINLKFETTAGSSANLRLLSDNYIELGIAQADLLDNAYKKNSNLRAIAGLYTEACQLVVKADSDIKSINDLSGHTVSIGAEESGTELNANQILEFSGMPSSIVTTKNMDYIDAANSLKSGDIDAFFFCAD